MNETQTAPAVAAQPTQALQAMPEEKSPLGKAISAVMEAVILEQPTYQGKLNVQMVWHYLQAPDICWGWAAEGAMPLNTKLLCVAACLKLGFTPGMGHVIWLGNKPYISAEGLRLKANSDPAWVYTQVPKMRPLTNDEREMYGIESNHMAGVCEAEVEYKGKTLKLEGLGIIDKNGNRPGDKTTKDRAMKLKTFAERDMLRRYYPAGISVRGEEDYDDEVRVVVAPAAPTLPPAVADKKRVELQNARDLLDGVMRKIVAHGKSWTQAGQAIGISVEMAGGYDDAEKIMPVVEALYDYLAKIEKEAAADKAKPAEAPAPTAGVEVVEAPKVEEKPAPAKAPKPAKAAKKVDAALVSNMNTEDVLKMAKAGADEAARFEEPAAVEPPKAPETPAAPAPNREGWSSSDPHKIAFREANPKPFTMIERLRPTPEVKADISLEMELMGLYDSQLKPGDDIQIAKGVRQWLTSKGADRSALTELSSAREAL